MIKSYEIPGARSEVALLPSHEKSSRPLHGLAGGRFQRDLNKRWLSKVASIAGKSEAQVRLPFIVNNREELPDEDNGKDEEEPRPRRWKGRRRRAELNSCLSSSPENRPAANPHMKEDERFLAPPMGIFSLPRSFKHNNGREKSSPTHRDTLDIPTVPDVLLVKKHTPRKLKPISTRNSNEYKDMIAKLGLTKAKAGLLTSESLAVAPAPIPERDEDYSETKVKLKRKLREVLMSKVKPVSKSVIKMGNKKMSCCGDMPSAAILAKGTEGTPLGVNYGNKFG